MPRPKDTGLGSSGYDSDFYKVERKPGQPNKLVLDEEAYRRQYGYKNPRDRFVSTFTKEHKAKYGEPANKREAMYQNRIRELEDSPSHDAFVEEVVRKRNVEKKTGLSAPQVNDKGSKRKPTIDETTARAQRTGGRDYLDAPLFQESYSAFMNLKQTAKATSTSSGKPAQKGAASNSKPASKPATQKPTAKPAAKPVAKPTAKPAAKPTASSKSAPAKKK